MKKLQVNNKKMSIVSFTKKKNIDLYKIGQFLMYLYILSSYIAHDFLISSSVNSICLYLFVGISFIYLICGAKINQGVLPFFIWFVIFIAFSYITLLYSPIQDVLPETMYLILVSIIVCFSISLYVKTKEDFNTLCWIYAISSFLCVVALSITGNLFGDASSRLGQEQFGNANIFSNIMMVATFYALWLLVYGNNNSWKKVLLVLIVVGNIYALMLAGGRTFFLMPFIFLMILLWFKTDKKGKKNIVKNTLLVCLIFAVIWALIMNVPELYNAIGVRMEGLLDAFSGNRGDSSSEIREKMKVLAMDKFWQSPLWGYCFDSFKYYALQAVGHFYYSHCNFTELLYNGGIFYFIAYYFIYFYIIKVAYKKRKVINTSYVAFTVATVITLVIKDYGSISYQATSTLILTMLTLLPLTISLPEEN